MEARNPVDCLRARLEVFRRAEPHLSLDSETFARRLDEEDPLARFRSQFEFPRLGSIPVGEVRGDPQRPVVYLLGNSLGLKPRRADLYMREQMEAWGQQAAFMHFNGRVPAALADQPGKEITADIVGATDLAEVTIMNGLTVNLHLLMLAFYQPRGGRNKILIEDHAFPSDRYAVRSLLRLKGQDEDCLLLVKPRPGEDTIRTEDILATIASHRSSLALVMLSGVQYRTGQMFQMEAVTRAGQEAGARVGWDLAHAVGNVQLNLSDWGVDFAVWCSYKYLNSGAGGIGGAFVHRRHHDCLPPHLEGWWSNAQDSRFEMRERLDPARGAEAFRLCNPPPWLAAINLASLEMFQEAGGMAPLLRKQLTLTGYLEHLLLTRPPLSGQLRVITPSDPQQRGCQLSLVFSRDLETVHRYIEARGVVCDVRYHSALALCQCQCQWSSGQYLCSGVT